MAGSGEPAKEGMIHMTGYRAVHDMVADADDPGDDNQLNTTAHRYVVLVGLALMACSTFMPSAWKVFGLRLTDIAAGAGFLCVVIPLALVAVYQSRIKKHFNRPLHVVLPIIGIVMVITRMAMGPFHLPNAFTNLWGILGTFFVFPLFQQLIELISGSVEMENDGRQVRYQE